MRAVAKAKICTEMDAMDLAYETEQGHVHEVQLFDHPTLWAELDGIFKEMWARYRDAGRAPWYKATFTLLPSGRARLRFEYPKPGVTALEMMFGRKVQK